MAGEIPSDRVFEDDDVIAFRDIAPRAPTHVLVMPRRHVPDAHAWDRADGPLLAPSSPPSAALPTMPGSSVATGW